MSYDCPKWKYGLSGFLIGIGITAAVLGHWVWISVGALPLIGGALQGAMKRKAQKVIDINSNGTQAKATKHTFRPGGH